MLPFDSDDFLNPDNVPLDYSFDQLCNLPCDPVKKAELINERAAAGLVQLPKKSVIVPKTCDNSCVINPKTKIIPKNTPCPTPPPPIKSHNMYEEQANRLSPEFAENFFEYFYHYLKQKPKK